MRKLLAPFFALLILLIIIPSVHALTFDSLTFSAFNAARPMGVNAGYPTRQPWLGQCFESAGTGYTGSATFLMSRLGAPVGQFQFEIWTIAGSYNPSGGGTCARGSTEIAESDPLLMLGLG